MPKVSSKGHDYLNWPHALQFACMLLGACTTVGQVTPLDTATYGTGAPTIALGYGFTGGTVSAVMPDGDHLEGQYTMTEPPDIGPFCSLGCNGAGGTFAADETESFPHGRPAIAIATDGKGGSIICDLALGFGQHGAGFCRTNQGNAYRVTF